MIRHTRCGPPPLVSCQMPTRNRPGFAERAVAQFLAQDWPRKELIVLDDSDPGLEPRIAEIPGLVRVVATGPMTLGDKRNLAVSLSRGEIVHHWDDDDWSGPGRLRRIAQPIWMGRAEAAMFRYRGLHLLRVPEGRFGRFRRGSPWDGRIHDGSLAIRRDAFARGLRYKPGLFETIPLVAVLTSHRLTVAGVDPGTDYVYVRQPARVWREPAWAVEGVPRPAWFPASDVAAMRQAWLMQDGSADALPGSRIPA